MVAVLGGKMNPYRDKHTGTQTFTRIFSEDTADDELEWHRDRKDRSVTVVESRGWKFQEDNMLPKELSPGDTLSIKANQYHRIIKGTGKLVVEIREYEPNDSKQSFR